jgi:hypothetical protein
MEALRPDPARGRELAAGVLALTVAIFLITTLFSDEWSAGARLLVAGLAAAFVAVLAVLAPDEPDGPRPWLSVILVSAFVLVVVALTELADALGAEGGGSSGTVTWVGAVTTATFAWFARRRDSAICTLLAGVAAVVTLLAAVDFVFGLDNPLRTFRWVLLLAALGLLAAGVSWADVRRRHAVALVDVAGLAALGIAITFAFSGLAGIFDELAFEGPGWGWELTVLAVGAALAVVAVHWREPGPGYLAAANLFAFTAMASVTDDASLVGWPLVLLIVAGLAIAAALRPLDGGPPPAEQDLDVTVRG